MRNKSAENSKAHVLSPPFLRLAEHTNRFKFRLNNYSVPPPARSQLSDVYFSEIIEEVEKEDGTTEASVEGSSLATVEDAEKVRSLWKLSGSSEEISKEREEEIFKASLKIEAFHVHNKQTIPTVLDSYFMNKTELENLFDARTTKSKIKIIDQKIGTGFPKGIGRIVIIELVLTVANFCRESNFSVEKSCTVLSIFYLTHKYFIHSLHLSADELYEYFKEFILSHSVENPPKTHKIFSFEDCKAILKLFLRIYARNLPLIKFLALPNYALYLNYEKVTKANEQEKSDLARAKKLAKQKKDGAGKKGKKGKDKDKKSKKGSKKGKK